MTNSRDWENGGPKLDRRGERGSPLQQERNVMTRKLAIGIVVLITGDAHTLVSAGATVDQAVPVQGSKRSGDAGSIHDHVTTKRGDRDLLFCADQAKQRKLRNVHPSIPQEVVVHS